ncbi:hypothetical protein RMSM_07021 [Rhodopirellula maiorica SM1]|uniref:Uncharacterized protein n=2 Tax=Novipirellula TaxID=2795426 RepID=M5R9K6_9BACT|nr:hypothetical protein RMSM_07021 [Rhodopirellula maiorica SM1]
MLGSLSLSLGCSDPQPVNVTDDADAAAIAEYEANEARLAAESEASMDE